MNAPGWSELADFATVAVAVGGVLVLLVKFGRRDASIVTVKECAAQRAGCAISKQDFVTREEFDRMVQDQERQAAARDARHEALNGAIATLTTRVTAKQLEQDERDRWIIGSLQMLLTANGLTSIPPPRIGREPTEG